MKKVDELGSSNSFAVPVAAWPSDQWWNVYGDAQLNALIDEALKNAPDLDLAQARLKAAAAQVQGAGATRLPEVTASAEIAEAKQSYDFLVPRQALTEGLERLWRRHLEHVLRTRLLGQEPRRTGGRRLGAARCRGRDRTNATDPLDLGRLRLRRSPASLYAA